MIKRFSIILIALVGLAQYSLAQRYSNYFTEQLGPINWKTISDSVAPNVPEYLFSHQQENEEYKNTVVEWIYQHPEEFDAAKMIDARLHAYVHWAIEADGKHRNDGPFGNPTFVYYPVNERKPIFIDNQNSDQDSLIYRNKLQNWYFRFDQKEYEKKYGKIPKILPYPKPIMHPDEFPDGYARSNFERYYPEFSKDPEVLKQYFELHEKQYGKSLNGSNK